MLMPSPDIYSLIIKLYVVVLLALLLLKNLITYFNYLKMRVIRTCICSYDLTGR